MSYKSILLPLLLERVGERRIKSTSYIPLIPAFSLKGEGAGTCVDTNALKEKGLFEFLEVPLTPKPDGFCKYPALNNPSQ
jgi:hypothetical protein